MALAKGVRLTSEEKSQINTLHKEGKSNRKIAQSLRKAHSIVNYYPSHSINRREKKKPGVKSKWTAQTIR
jgi:IS30 family transposase